MKIRYLISSLFAFFLVANAYAGDQFFYYQNDIHGSAVAITDSTGNVVWSGQYSGYGTPRNGVDSQVESVAFQGKMFESDTGLSYFGARYYDSDLGAFVSPDPIGFSSSSQLSFNRYIYGLDNPYRYDDPTGMASEDEELKGRETDPVEATNAGNSRTWVNEDLQKIRKYYPNFQYSSVDSGSTTANEARDLNRIVAEVESSGECGPQADVPSGAKGADDYVDLASSQRRRHILDGDATGGGHRPGTGTPGKSEFPQGWSDDKIMHEISDVATDPNAVTRAGRGGRTITEGTRDGIDIRVIQERNGDIVSGFPTNVPRNP